MSRIGVGPIGSCFFDHFLSSFTGDLKFIWLFYLCSKGERAGKFDQRVLIGSVFWGSRIFWTPRFFQIFSKKGVILKVDVENNH